jgi:hypothetical protein
MKRSVGSRYVVALSVVLAVCTALPAAAALQYEYIQTIRSDADKSVPTDLSARVTLDGARSRVDFISGNAYPPGTYMITADGSRRMLFVDPGNKSYTEVNTSSIASAIGSSNIQITNVKSDVVKLTDAQTIAGIPADHYRLTISYDITVVFRNMPLKQSVRTEIDQWTTVKFGDVFEAALVGNSLLTGNPQVDDVIRLETTKIKGFPLKQRVKIVSVNEAKPLPGSQLKLPSTMTKTREMTVTSIREANPDSAQFSLPAGYQRIDLSRLADKAPMQVLNLDGEAK